MLPITPSNFHFFYDKWTKQLESLDRKDKNIGYAKKIANELWTFSEDMPNNALSPCISKFSKYISHKTITPELIIKVLDKINQFDNKLML